MTAIDPPAYASEELDALAASPYRTSGERLLGDLRRTLFVDLGAPNLVLGLACASLGSNGRTRDRRKPEVNGAERDRVPVRACARSIHHSPAPPAYRGDRAEATFDEASLYGRPLARRSSR